MFTSLCKCDNTKINEYGFQFLKNNIFFILKIEFEYNTYVVWKNCIEGMSQQLKATLTHDLMNKISGTREKKRAIQSDPKHGCLKKAWKCALMFTAILLLSAHRKARIYSFLFQPTSIKQLLVTLDMPLKNTCPIWSALLWFVVVSGQNKRNLNSWISPKNLYLHHWEACHKACMIHLVFSCGEQIACIAKCIYAFLCVFLCIYLSRLVESNSLRWAEWESTVNVTWNLT